VKTGLGRVGRGWEAMGVRELKEEALDLYSRRKFADCARTYGRLLELEPRDPHLYVRHAEAWRRAGERKKAIASYRAAAELLLRQGCEARARAALKVALELDPQDAELAQALERLTPAYRPRREEVLPSRIPEHLRDMVELHTRPANVPGRLALPPAPASTAAPLPSPAEVRRLSPNTIAMRAAPGTRWVVVSSRTPLTAYEVEELERVVTREFTLEVTVVAEDPAPLN
jgi:tetratricopeptide (TPR) repeat protein